MVPRGIWSWAHPMAGGLRIALTELAVDDEQMTPGLRARSNSRNTSVEDEFSNVMLKTQTTIRSVPWLSMALLDDGIDGFREVKAHRAHPRWTWHMAGSRVLKCGESSDRKSPASSVRDWGNYGKLLGVRKWIIRDWSRT